MKQVLIAIIIFTTFCSCSFFELRRDNHEQDDKVIVSVDNEKLYQSDLNKIFTKDLKPDDSLRLRHLYIENWTKKQIILRKAKINLTEEQEQKLLDMVQNYQEDLYINSYKEALVSKAIDSVISEKEIEAFYTSHQNIFKLKEPLFQYRLLSVIKGDRSSGKMLKLFTKNDSISIDELYNGAYDYHSLKLDDNDWTDLTTFYKKFPKLDGLKKARLLKKNNYIYYNTNNLDYHIYINKVLLRGQIAPLSHVHSDIERMIFHQKKLDYLQEIDNKLIKEAVEGNIYKNYEQK